MRSILGVLLLGFSLMLILLEFALLESEGPSAGAGGVRPDWWQHVGRVLVALVVGWIGVRVLRGSFLSRLVRGRGLTPAPEDE